MYAGLHRNQQKNGRIWLKSQKWGKYPVVCIAYVYASICVCSIECKRQEIEMQKPLVVMAVESEGQGLLEPLGLDVLYCGVGKTNAAYHLTRRLLADRKREDAFSYVLNTGSAGSKLFPPACWSQPTAETYLGRVSKEQIIEALREADKPRPYDVADMKKPQLAAHAEKQLAGPGWLPSHPEGKEAA
jgi:hypothetical protein